MSIDKNTSTVIEPNLEGLTKVDTIIYQLMKLFLNKGHRYHIINFIAWKKTLSTGTLRNNCKINPKEVTAKKLKRGEYVWRSNKNVYMSKWKDKRDVLCTTTKNNPKIVSTINRYGFEKKNKPIEIKDYNDFMSDVDRSDQIVSYYSYQRKKN